MVLLPLMAGIINTVANTAFLRLSFVRTVLMFTHALPVSHLLSMVYGAVVPTSDREGKGAEEDRVRDASLKKVNFSKNVLPLSTS